MPRPSDQRLEYSLRDGHSWGRGAESVSTLGGHRRAAWGGPRNGPHEAVATGLSKHRSGHLARMPRLAGIVIPAQLASNLGGSALTPKSDSSGGRGGRAPALWGPAGSPIRASSSGWPMGAPPGPDPSEN
eukprot:scaffold2090_cov225-Prasinococcus_capsulatus_cf.AAC.2